MKYKLTKNILLATGVTLLSASILVLSIKTTKSLTPDCSKSSTTYL